MQGDPSSIQKLPIQKSSLQGELKIEDSKAINAFKLRNLAKTQKEEPPQESILPQFVKQTTEIQSKKKGKKKKKKRTEKNKIYILSLDLW